MTHIAQFADELEKNYGIKVLRCLLDGQGAEVDKNAADFVLLEVMLSSAQMSQMRETLSTKQTTAENFLLQAYVKASETEGVALSSEYDIGYFLSKHNGFILYTNRFAVAPFIEMLGLLPENSDFAEWTTGDDTARYEHRKSAIAAKALQLEDFEQKRLEASELRAKERKLYEERRARNLERDKIVEIDDKLCEYAAKMEADFNVRIVKCLYDEQANKSAVTARDLVRVAVWLSPAQIALAKKNQGGGGIDPTLIHAFNIESAKGNCFFDQEYEVGISFNTYYGIHIFTAKAVVPTYLALLLKDEPENLYGL